MIDDYSDFEPIDDGERARIFSARHEATGERVVVKVLKSHDRDQDRSQQLTRLQAMRSHLDPIEHVAPIRELGLDRNGDLFVVMALYSSSLERRIVGGPTPWPEALALARRLAISISLAHAKGISHLHLRPSKVLLDDDGSPWLTDFGFAEMIGGPTVVISPYAAPELLEGDKACEKSDLFAIAAILYALLTGSAPRWASPAAGSTSILATALRDPLPHWELPDETPHALRNVLIRGLARDQRQRPSSATEVVGLLTDVLSGRTVDAPASLVGFTLDAPHSASHDAPNTSIGIDPSG